MTGTTQCGSTIQYQPGARFTCTQPAGHKGAHFGTDGFMAWTCSTAVIPPRDYPPR